MTQREQYFTTMETAEQLCRALEDHLKMAYIKAHNVAYNDATDPTPDLARDTLRDALHMYKTGMNRRIAELDIKTLLGATREDLTFITTRLNQKATNARRTVSKALARVKEKSSKK